MLTELNGKGGCVCQAAREGKLRCPLIVRPTSEDVITGHLFQALGVLNPRWWVPDLLNAALGAPRFRRQYHRRLRIDLWRNRPRYPRDLLPWEEGSTQVDATLAWEGPPTTVFFEMKYKSAIAPRTANGDGTCGYPGDQLIRNARVGLLECGWFGRDELIALPPRDFVLILVAPERGHRLVERYRDPGRLRAAIPQSERLIGLPAPPFVGELGYGDIVRVLRCQRRWFGRAERRVVDDLCDYLEFKRAGAAPEGTPSEQTAWGFAAAGEGCNEPTATEPEPRTPTTAAMPEPPGDGGDGR
jgi:hypothetical protein